MPSSKPVCQTIVPWLRANLGPNCLAPMTSTDMYALRAAVQLIELYAYDRETVLLEAFRLIVLRMQPVNCVREMAYHSIAHVMDWSDRRTLWLAAGLPEIKPRRCKFE